MDAENVISWLVAITATLISAIVSIYTNYLRKKLARIENLNRLKTKYSSPLLKASEELHNKINDINKNQKWVVIKAFAELQNKVDKYNKLSDIFASSADIYRASFLYLFARFFAAVEAIKKDVVFFRNNI